ncbi:Ig-like domain-containing protein [Salidesulfovibrio onnuriiensis]|uniref:Ig-like domain-containing protein n=1 Tax=Salidesulfovibrio onnuriiensis TaxID=2583823 RepID=UPI001C9CFB56
MVTDAGKAPTALHGTVTVNADGTLTYTPAANYNGPDTITYTVPTDRAAKAPQPWPWALPRSTTDPWPWTTLPPPPRTRQ